MREFTTFEVRIVQKEEFVIEVVAAHRSDARDIANEIICKGGTPMTPNGHVGYVRTARHHGFDDDAEIDLWEVAEETGNIELEISDVEEFAS